MGFSLLKRFSIAASVVIAGCSSDGYEELYKDVSEELSASKARLQVYHEALSQKGNPEDTFLYWKQHIRDLERKNPIVDSEYGELVEENERLGALIQELQDTQHSIQVHMNGLSNLRQSIYDSLPTVSARDDFSNRSNSDQMRELNQKANFFVGKKYTSNPAVECLPIDWIKDIVKIPSMYDFWDNISPRQKEMSKIFSLLNNTVWGGYLIDNVEADGLICHSDLLIYGDNYVPVGAMYLPSEESVSIGAELDLKTCSRLDPFTSKLQGKLFLTYFEEMFHALQKHRDHDESYDARSTSSNLADKALWHLLKEAEAMAYAAISFVEAQDAGLFSDDVVVGHLSVQIDAIRNVSEGSVNDQFQAAISAFWKNGQIPDYYTNYYANSIAEPKDPERIEWSIYEDTYNRYSIGDVKLTLPYDKHSDVVEDMSDTFMYKDWYKAQWGMDADKIHASADKASSLPNTEFTYECYPDKGSRIPEIKVL